MEKPPLPLHRSLAFIVPAEHIRFACCGECSTKRKPLTKVRGFFVASATVSCQSRTVQDSNRAALTTPVGKVSNQPSWAVA